MLRAATPWTLLFVFAAISLAALASLLFILLGGAEPSWAHINFAANESSSKSRAAQLREKLNMPITLDRGIDVSAPLKDAVEFLSDRYDVPFLFDTRGFEAIGVMKVEYQPVQLPPMAGVKLKTVLQMLLSQVKGDVYTGTYMVKDDYILLTTTYHADHAFHDDPPGGPLEAPTVDVDLFQKPLSAALREIGDQTGANVVLDERVGETARKPVTAVLTRVRVDTAVRLLADMSGLRVAVLDNVLYVTSVENARELEAEHDARRRQVQKEKEQREEEMKLIPAPWFK